MADQTNPGIAEIISNIQADVTAIVKGELELAKAELMPQAKAAGIGAGLFGAAAYFAITGGTLLFLGLSFLLSLGFMAWFNLPLLGAAAWGFSLMAVLVFLLAGVLALVGKQQLNFTTPDATIAQAEASVASFKSAIASGKQEVAGLSLTGKPQQPALG